MDETNTKATAVFGGGCFWCIEALFARLDGVLIAESGYAGGERENPSYAQVCTGLTGHAEVVRVEWNLSKLSYRDLLEVFFRSHDPTTPDRQGADVGSQYRSIVLFSGLDQKREAEAYVRELDASGKFKAPVVTELRPLDRFWPAEEEHRNYYERHPYAGYCRVVIAPKLEKAGFSPAALATD